MIPLAQPSGDLMTLAEFLAWDPGGGRMWQLVDGVPMAMAPPSVWHGAVQAELARLIGNHLVAQGSPCALFVTPGVVTLVHADRNMRIPDLAVSCADPAEDAGALVDPVLLVEVLSPGNQAETWINVWTYTLLPSVQEILVLRTKSICADLLRRGPDGAWPDAPERVTDGDLVLGSIGFRIPLADLYRTTGLRRIAG